MNISRGNHSPLDGDTKPLEISALYSPGDIVEGSSKRASNRELLAVAATISIGELAAMVFVRVSRSRVLVGAPL